MPGWYGWAQEFLDQEEADARYRGDAGSPSAQRLLEKLKNDHEAASVVFLGDSTGDETTEWAYLLAQSLAARYPTRTVTYRVWDFAGDAWGSPTTLQTGSLGASSKTLAFHNANVTGRRPWYHLGARLNAQVASNNPDLIIVSHGHNLRSGIPAVRGAFSSILESLSLTAPFSGILCVAQNPRTDATNLNDIAYIHGELQGLCAMRGYGYANVYQAFRESGQDLSTLTTEGVHPNAAGQAIWHQEVLKAFDYHRGRAPLLPQPSSLGGIGKQLITNGDFATFTAAMPNGWNAGNVTASKDLTNFETGTWGVKLVSTTAAQAFMTQSLLATMWQPYKGRQVTLAARMRMPSGSNAETGSLAIQDGVANVVSAPFLDASGFVWHVLTKYVEPTAASLTVVVYVNQTAVVSEVTVDRIVLSPGAVPRDM